MFVNQYLELHNIRKEVPAKASLCYSRLQPTSKQGPALILIWDLGLNKSPGGGGLRGQTVYAQN